MKLKKTLSAALAGLMLISAVPSAAAVEESEENTGNGEVVKTELKAPKIAAIKNTSKGITLKWNAAAGAEKYIVYAKKGKASFKKVKTLDSSATSFTHTGLKSGTTYAYQISAKQGDKALKSKKKSLVRVGTSKLTTSNTADAIKVSWKKVSGATKYVLQYKKPSSKKFFTAYKGTKTSYKDDNLGSGTTYEFRVKANIKTTSGAYSSVATQTFLEKPTVAAAESPFNMEGISVTWQKVKGAKGYIIYRSLKYKTSYKRIAKVGDKLSYFDTDVEGINSYKYYVVAYNGSYKSVKSNVDWSIYAKYVSDDTPFYLTIKKGQTYKDISVTLDEYGALSLLKFWSENPDIAKVDDRAVVKGVKKGTAIMHAKGDYKGKGHKLTVYVTVK